MKILKSFSIILTLLLFMGSHFAFAINSNVGSKKRHVTHSSKSKKTKYAKSSKSRQYAAANKAKRKRSYMQGIASYYGENDGFNGGTMANGDTFDTNDVYSAAHPTLPLGTKLMVTNIRNGRTIYVEVRDRMPKQGRVIDLSSAAARYLGMHRRGLTYVNLVKVGNQEFESRKRYLQVEGSDTGAQG